MATKTSTSVSNSSTPSLLDAYAAPSQPGFVFEEETNSMVMRIPASGFKLNKHRGNVTAQCFFWTKDFGVVLGKLLMTMPSNDTGSGVSFSFKVRDVEAALAAGVQPWDEEKDEVVPQHVAEITGAGDETF